MLGKGLSFHSRAISHEGLVRSWKHSQASLGFLDYNKSHHLLTHYYSPPLTISRSILRYVARLQNPAGASLFREDK